MSEYPFHPREFRLRRGGGRSLVTKPCPLNSSILATKTRFLLHDFHGQWKWRFRQSAPSPASAGSQGVVFVTRSIQPVCHGCPNRLGAVAVQNAEGSVSTPCRGKHPVCRPRCRIYLLHRLQQRQGNLEIRDRHQVSGSPVAYIDASTAGQRTLVYALDYKTGKVKWNRDRRPITYSPVIFYDIVYLVQRSYGLCINCIVDK